MTVHGKPERTRPILPLSGGNRAGISQLNWFACYRISADMLRRVADRRPSGFVEPCRPSKASAPPSGREWVHEIKHDGFRLLVRREGPLVRCFTRGGYDWA